MAFLPSVTRAEYRGGYKVHLQFHDGVEGTVDFARWLEGPIFAALKANAERIFKGGNSDFASGDAVFLAALNGPDRFSSVTSTHGSEDMIEREFDHHTSMVVDPPDGRIPALTAEGRRDLRPDEHRTARLGDVRPTGSA